MANRSDLPDTEMVDLLEDLATHLAVPRHHSIATAVRARLETDEQRIRILPRLHPQRRIRTKVLVAAFALVLVVGTLLVLSPSTRNAVADWFGLRGVDIEQRNEPVEAPVGGRLSLGKRVNFAEATRTVDFEVWLPPQRRFGKPDEIYVAKAPSGGRVTLLYKPRRGIPPTASGVGLLLTEFRAGIPDNVIRKTFGTGTQLEQVTVDGAVGFWFHGQPHALTFADENGQFFQDKSRLAGNTLIWEHGPLTLRLESAFAKDDAIRMAESLDRVR